MIKIRGVFLMITMLLLLGSKSYASAVNDNETSSQGNSINSLGLGLSVTKRLELINGVISFDESEDSIFIAPEIFYENFLNGSDVKDQYGFGFNFGYAFKDFDFFTSLGGLKVKFKYKIEDEVLDYEHNTFYYGFGAAYNINPVIAAKVNAKFYEISFTDRVGSSFQSRNNTVTLSLSIKI